MRWHLQTLITTFSSVLYLQQASLYTHPPMELNNSVGLTWLITNLSEQLILRTEYPGSGVCIIHIKQQPLKDDDYNVKLILQV